MDFTFHGVPYDNLMQEFADRVGAALTEQGHELVTERPGVKLVLSQVNPDKNRPFRRRAQATYVVALLRLEEEPKDFLKTAYPWLIRSLANLEIAVVGPASSPKMYFVTLERGYYPVVAPYPTKEHLAEVLGRLTPLASSQLVVENLFDEDLDPELAEDERTRDQFLRAGRALESWNLLPTPFPMQEILPPEDYHHVQRLYQMGGLSYGNLSSRQSGNRFWMSASGVDKSNLRVIGEDILLVKGYDAEHGAMRLSVPPGIKPRRVSVDAIEHLMIYSEHPTVGAIVHVHAWMAGVPSTDVNYPCGTMELAQAVANEVRKADDPAMAVVGQRNHGLTITGRDLDDILERIDGKLITQVPMS